MALPRGYEQYSLPTMGAENKQIYDLLSSQFMQGAPDLYAQLRSQAAGGVSPIEGQIQRKYQEDIIPQLGAAYGMSGTQKSSGFQGQVARQGRNLAEDLASERFRMQQDAMKQLMGIGNQLLGTATEEFGLTKKEDLMTQIMQLLGMAGGQLGGLFGGSALTRILG